MGLEKVNMETAPNGAVSCFSIFCSHKFPCDTSFGAHWSVNLQHDCLLGPRPFCYNRLLLSIGSSTYSTKIHYVKNFFRKISIQHGNGPIRGRFSLLWSILSLLSVRHPLGVHYSSFSSCTTS